MSAVQNRVADREKRWPTKGRCKVAEQSSRGGYGQAEQFGRFLGCIRADMSDHAAVARSCTSRGDRDVNTFVTARHRQGHETGECDVTENRWRTHHDQRRAAPGRESMGSAHPVDTVERRAIPRTSQLPIGDPSFASRGGGERVVLEPGGNRFRHRHQANLDGFGHVRSVPPVGCAQAGRRAQVPYLPRLRAK